MATMDSMDSMDNSDAPPATRTQVASGSLTLAAWTRGDAGPPILFMHGYPDTHTVWDPIVDRLSPAHRCIAYDVRGAGGSDAPNDRDDYRIARLLDDVVAVMDTLSPDDAVHLVGHDWGSVVAWEAVCRSRSDDRLRGRIESLTSISGPCLGHIGAFYRAAARASWRSQDGRRLKREAIVQAARSWYVYAFHVVVLSDRVVRARSRRIAATPAGQGRHFGPTLPDDAVNGLSLYRANVGQYEPIPGGPRTDVPTLLIVPTRDRYVSPAMTSQVERYVPSVDRAEIDAGHWAMWSHPDELSDLISAHVARSVSQDPTSAGET
jgi:pimeloyl-ACP methyl ester carboxylesterase